jgi:hypothetical protein
MKVGGYDSNCGPVRIPSFARPNCKLNKIIYEPKAVVYHTAAPFCFLTFGKTGILAYEVSSPAFYLKPPLNPSTSSSLLLLGTTVLIFVIPAKARIHTTSFSILCFYPPLVLFRSYFFVLFLHPLIFTTIIRTPRLIFPNQQPII